MVSHPGWQTQHLQLLCLFRKEATGRKGASLFLHQTQVQADDQPSNPSQVRKKLTIPMHDEGDIGSKRVLSLLSRPTNGASADGDVSRTKTGGHL